MCRRPYPILRDRRTRERSRSAIRSRVLMSTRCDGRGLRLGHQTERAHESGHVVVAVLLDGEVLIVKTHIDRTMDVHTLPCRGDLAHRCRHRTGVRAGDPVLGHADVAPFEELANLQAYVRERANERCSVLADGVPSL